MLVAELIEFFLWVCYNLCIFLDTVKKMVQALVVLLISNQFFRSGSEGFYPQLVEFTEKKLKEINPKRFCFFLNQFILGQT